jgi:hypothetical protein
MSDADKTSAIMAALKKKHDKDCWVEELSFTDRNRRIDLFVIQPTAGKGFGTTAYEVKVSRADFRRETHDKQREARLYSERFYYVTPPGLVEKTEIPDWAGLMELKDNGRFKEVIPAPRLPRETPSWELVVSILRYSGTCHRDIQASHRIALKQRDDAWKKLEEWQRSFGWTSDPSSLREKFIPAPHHRERSRE